METENKLTIRNLVFNIIITLFFFAYALITKDVQLQWFIFNIVLMVNLLNFWLELKIMEENL